jgi:hypothetical protein
MSIHVHIERLVLEGFPSGDPTIGAAVEAELTRLLTERGISGAVSHHEARVAANPIALVRPNDSHNLGKHIGGALYQVLNSSRV